ncbi:CHD3-type chromatin-remodeling factor PICKLE [Platanthera guangdongensis]|uniref:CHD3-type chromatin-remodeling factor PICKLE n=1 Tax=Platanthera guangdongensis TaxID=2320717 RepID=A0ABR2LE88_9ASPA
MPEEAPTIPQFSLFYHHLQCFFLEIRIAVLSSSPSTIATCSTNHYHIIVFDDRLETATQNTSVRTLQVLLSPRPSACARHPHLVPEFSFRKQLLDFSGKMPLLDKMLVKLKEQGHRVLIYSQFQHMLDLLEDYLTYKNWSYERIDGNISGAERQIRIDRFNAKDSTRFCFVLSTRAGGLGINLATADTVIIYDSDWNPHADFQAMARAHRLGQTNKVMIYRLITRGTIEERMMQLTKKKMILEHLVVGRLKAQTVNQEELDDIIRYGSKDLFADESDEAGKARQIHYDDAAVDRLFLLLNRDEIGVDEASLDEEDDELLKAFKVANFEFIDEVEAAAAREEETKKKAIAEKHSTSNPDRSNYWEELLGDKYEMIQIEKFTSMGKGKRNRKQATMCRGEGIEVIVNNRRITDIRWLLDSEWRDCRANALCTDRMLAMKEKISRHLALFRSHTFAASHVVRRHLIPTLLSWASIDIFAVTLIHCDVASHRRTRCSRCRRSRLASDLAVVAVAVADVCYSDEDDNQFSRCEPLICYSSSCHSLTLPATATHSQMFSSCRLKCSVMMPATEEDPGMPSSEDDDYSYEDDLSDTDMEIFGQASGKKGQFSMKRSRVDLTEPHPLMEGEGRSLRVRGFNQNQRAAFLHLLMRLVGRLHF